MGCTESLNEAAPLKTMKTEVTDSTLASFQTRYPRVAMLPQLKAAFEECEAAGTHVPLLACVGLKNLVRHFSSVPKWASAPLTVGCVVLSVLNWLVKRRKLVIPEPELLSQIPLLLACFHDTSASLRQHLVYFLFKVTSYSSPAFALALVDQGLFQYLNKFWFTRHFHFQQCLVKFCVATFANNPEVKRRFEADDGVTWLIKQLEYTSFSGCQFRCILEALGTYMMDEAELSVEFTQTVLRIMGEPTFRKFSHKNLSGADCEVFDEFLEKLIEFNERN